ncbi:MAG: Arc family DNA-binding protein [Ectothiorhodospiraceae bacterium]|nr:Arc family DNA-binding protein [Ectothiorhodospiraceae bacterium]
MDNDDRYTRITLRIPKDLHGQLSSTSQTTSKSLNAEIISRLEESFKAAQPKDEELKRLYLRVIYLLNKQKLSKAEATELKNAETAIQVLEKSKST